jgi:hypothetical protein
MRWLLARTLICMIFLMLVCAGALGVARALPIAARVKLLHLDDCQFPCWIGIIPQKTSMIEARARLYEVYTHEPDIVINKGTKDDYTISSKIYGRLMTVYFMVSYLGEDAPISEINIEFDLNNPLLLAEIFSYLPKFPYVDIEGNWTLLSPKWTLQGVGPNYDCGQYRSINATDLVAVLTLGNNFSESYAQYFYKWRGFRKCYYPSELSHS